MTKLRYRLTGDQGVEWQAVDGAADALGPWRKSQQEARDDGAYPIPQPDGDSSDLTMWPAWHKDDTGNQGA